MQTGGTSAWCNMLKRVRYVPREACEEGLFWTVLKDCLHLLKRCGWRLDSKQFVFRFETDVERHFGSPSGEPHSC
jgi:hypothetical protein